MRKSLLFFSVLFTPMLVEAHDRGELPVVLSGSRINFSSEIAPQPVSVITRDMIINSGARNISELLRLIPGFTVGYKYGNQPTIINKGLTHEQNKRMQIKIDGHSVYLPATGGTFFSGLPIQIDDIDRIEVQHGPSSAWNGANALLSTIHIFTKPPISYNQFSVATNYGENGIRDTVIQQRVDINNHWISSFSFKEYEDSGLKLREDDRRDRSFLNRHDIDFDNNASLTVLLGYGDSLYEAGGTDEFSDPVRDLKQQRFNLMSTYYKNYRFGHDSTTKLTIDRFNQDHVLNGINPLLGNYSIDYSYKTQSNGIEHYHTFVNNHTTFVLGGSLVKNEYQSMSRINNDVDNVVKNSIKQVFSQVAYEHNFQNITHVGLMYESSNLSTKDEFSYQISHVYNPFDNHFIRAGYSVGFRLPSGFENYGTNTVNIDALNFPVYTLLSSGYQKGGLLSEKISENNIGYYYINNNNNIRFDVNFYQSTISNYIEFVRREEKTQQGTPFAMVSDYINHNNEITLDGYQLGLNFSPIHNLDLKLSYSQANTKGVLDNGFDLSKTHPKHIYSAYVNYKHNNNINLNLRFDKSSKSQWSDNEITSGFEKLDANIRYCDSVNNQNRYCVSLHGENLLSNVSDARDEYYWSKMFFLRAQYFFR